MTESRPQANAGAARAADAPLALPASVRVRLADRLDQGLRRSRRTGRRTLVAVTVPIPAGIDVSACVLRARSADSRAFCLEQPARGGFALAGLGAAATVEARGDRRFTEAAEACRRLTEGALHDDPGDDPARPPPAGPVWLGGFAFDGRGGDAPEWSSLAPAQLVMPELALARQDGEARLTVTAVVDGDESHATVLEGLERSLARLDPEAAMPLLDPDPVSSPRVAGAMPPAHYEGAVARAVERIRAGELEKVVLAREVRVHAPRPADAGAVLGGLRGAFPACYCYLVATPEAAFVGASPGAARSPRRRARPIRGARRYHPAQRRSRGRRPSGRAAPAKRQGPRGAGDRGAADRAHSRTRQPVGRSGRGARL